MAVLYAPRLFADDHFFDCNISDNHISDKSTGIPYFRHGHISDMDIFPTWTYFQCGNLPTPKAGVQGAAAP